MGLRLKQALFFMHFPRCFCLAQVLLNRRARPSLLLVEVLA